VSEVSEVMSRIAQDTNTHAARLRQANVTVGEMDQITQSNAAMSEQASAAARGLAVQSGSLMKELGRFRVGGVMQPVASAPRMGALRAA
jgi:methyl-accepting chemotaxis protein